MPTTDLAGLVYPSGVDAPYVATALMGLTTALDPKVVLSATDSADRDARYGAAPANVLVVCAASKSVWLKTGPNVGDWLTLYSDTGWVTSGFTIATGWGPGSYLQGRRIGPNIEVRGELVYTSTTDILAGVYNGVSPGNVGDTNLVTVPSTFAPAASSGYVVGTLRCQITSGTINMYSSGVINLVDLHTSSVITNGDLARFSLSYFAG